MQTEQRSWSKNIIMILLPGLFFLLPLLFNYWTFEKFELSKIAGLYSILGVLFLCLAIKGLRSRSFLHPRSAVFRWSVLYVLAMSLSAVFSMHPYTSWFGQYLRSNGSLVNYLFLLGLLYVVSIQKTERLFITCASALMISGLVVSGYGVARWLGMGYSFMAIEGIRATSTFGEPTNLSGFLVMLLPLCLYFSFFSEKKFLRIAGGISFVLGYWCLLATYSRGAYAAGAVSMLVLLVLLVREGLLGRIRSQMRTWLVLLICMVLITFVVIIKPQTSNEAFADRETNSLALRLEVWKTVPELFLKAPFLGTGPETFQYAFSPHRPASLNVYPQWESRFDRAHNEYLNLLVTVGGLGLLMYLLVWAAAARSLWITRGSAAEPSVRTLVPFVASSLAAFAAQIFFSFSSTTTLAMFFLLLGFLVSRDGRREIVLPSRGVIRATYAVSLVVFSVLVLAFVTFFWRFMLADASYTAGYRAMNRLQEYPKAITLQERALELFPYESRYYRDLGDSAIRLALTEARKPGGTGSNAVEEMILKASGNFDRAIELDPYQVNTYLTYARGYYDLGIEYPALYALAEEHAWQAIALEPTNVMAYEFVALSQAAEAKRAEAESTFLHIIELKPDLASSYSNLGRFYFDQGRDDLSRAQFLHVLELTPDDTVSSGYLDRIQARDTPEEE